MIVTEKPKAADGVHEVYRFRPDELVRFRQALPRPAVSTDTTDIQAGFLLGIQYVLDKLEQGWTVK